MTQVMIAGAGPTGLMLACELRRAGVAVQLVDRADRRGTTSRAAGLHPRTLEILDQRGMAEEFLAIGRPLVRVPHFAGISVDWSTLPTRFPYMFGVLQSVTESILERFALQLGVAVQWSTEVVGLQDDGDGVAVALRGPTGLTQQRVDYLVGCDGAGSAVRRAAGIPFDGADGQTVTLLGDVELDEAHGSWRIYDRRPAGALTLMPLGALGGQSWWRVMVTEYEPEQTNAPMNLNRLRECTIRVAGTDFGMHAPVWLSSFTDRYRQATQYRCGRVLLAGDAAHIHPPMGAQGMNLGMQDAVNLGWKLAAVVNGDAGQALLDTYHEERHPQAGHVLANTQAQSALIGPGAGVSAMRAQLAALLRDERANERLAAAMSGMDVCYAPEAAHPLIGRRVPDSDVRGRAGQRRVFDLLHGQRAVLLDFDALPERAAAVGQTVEYLVAQKTVRQWRLPVVGWVDVPSALLIRPDGHVAWVSSDSRSDGLPEALDQLQGRTTNT
jgi:2-polyprenyl-6-methoxyphenol hydroxylase-like FAD-dependent oxidoreductase